MADDLKATVRRVIEEIYGAGSLDAADEIFAADFVGHDPALPEPLRGPAGLKEAAAGYRAAFPDLRVTVNEQVGEGDVVATRWTATGTQHGELFGIAPTGKQATVSGVTIDRFADDRIVESWVNWDALGLLQQLGAIPAPATA